MTTFDKKVVYFLKVVEKGSFSAAARSLYLSQAALSLQVKQLEEEVGITLLDRSGYRPQLTPAGKEYYRKVKELINDYNQFMHQLTLANRQTIKVAFTGINENQQLIKLIEDFQHQNPQVEFRYHRGNFNCGLHRLKTKQVDVTFGVESTFAHHPELCYQNLIDYQMHVIVSDNDLLATKSQVTPDQIKDRQMVILSDYFGKDAHEETVRHCQQDGFPLSHIKYQADSLDDLLSNVATGNCIAIISADVVNLGTLKAIPLIKTHHHNHYAVGYQKDARPIVKQFVSYAQNWFNQHH